jgi:hypothetical protein
MKFHEIKFISVEGRVSPTEISFDNSQLTLDIGELEEKFSFGEIRFENPALYIQLNSTADIETELDALVNGSNGSQQSNMNITDLLIPSLANTRKDLTEYGFKEFLNSFQNKLPTEFIVSGSATGNPNYLLGEVHQDDSIASSLLLELPLDIGISGGVFVDTFDIDLGSIDESELKRVNYGIITIEFENEVPVQLAFTARSLDSLNNEKLAIPPRPIQPQNLDYILVNAPNLNSQGNVITPGTTITEVEIFNDEIREFLANRKLAVRFDFLTPPEGNLDPVKFRITDMLKLKAYATLNYRADID